jgi:hypothetical protein
MIISGPEGFGDLTTSTAAARATVDTCQVPALRIPAAMYSSCGAPPTPPIYMPLPDPQHGWAGRFLNFDRPRPVVQIEAIGSDASRLGSGWKISSRHRLQVPTEACRARTAWSSLRWACPSRRDRRRRKNGPRLSGLKRARRTNDDTRDWARRIPTCSADGCRCPRLALALRMYRTVSPRRHYGGLGVKR